MTHNNSLIHAPTHVLKEEECAREAPTRDMTWVPLRGKETEVWAARSPDGKRLYNVRCEWRHEQEGCTPLALWAALWSRMDDGIPNVFTSRFLSVHEAKLACETLEHSFPIDTQEVEEFKRYSQSKLSPSGWTFQGIFNGVSCWTFRPNKRNRECYVITNDMKQTVHNKQQYELTLRTLIGDKYTNVATLKIESINMFDTLEKAQAEVKRLLR